MISNHIKQLIFMTKSEILTSLSESSGFTKREVAGLLEDLGAWGTFATFAGVTALGTVFIAVVMPETKGRTLEEIERGWLKGTAHEPSAEQ